MKEKLTSSELAFLSRQGLSPDDVFDARHYSQARWFVLIKQAGKTIALGSKRRAAGHRLRSSKGHCVQCDTSKIAFAGRYNLKQFVYIAGSRTAKLLKIGTCKDIEQRLRQICTERHGSASDWEVLYFVYIPRAVEVETTALARLSKFAVHEPYWKNGRVQTSIELLRCRFTTALSGLQNVLGDGSPFPWRKPDCTAYEFADETPPQ